MKRIFISFLLFLLTFSLLGFSASADTPVDGTNPEENEYNIYSEGDLIKLWIDSTDDELKEIGYSETEIEEIRSYNFEEMFLERAALPKHTLQNYGYSNSQIEVLKAYEGETITSDAVVLAAASDVSVSFSKNANTSTNKGVFVNASWNWNIVPMIKTTDLFVFAWHGVNSSGATVDLTPTTRSGTIRYHRMTTGVHDHNSAVSGSFDSLKKAVSFNITMTKSDNYYWAKSGIVTMKLVPPSNGSISHVNLGAAYGHKTIAVSASFSVGSGLGISFTPALRVVKSGSKNGRVSSTGNVTLY